MQERRTFPEYERAMQSLQDWARTSGAQLLVIDPIADDGELQIGMAARGVHVTWVSSGIDGLIKFGRIRPRAVIVSPDVRDLPAADLIAGILREEPVTVIAGVDPDRADAATPLCAGADATLARPYTAEAVWQMLIALVRGLDDHARLVFGPIHLDATAYTVHVHGVRIPDLPRKEFEVLRTLMYRAPEVVADDELSIAVWGAPQQHAGSGSTMSVTVRRVRAKLSGGVDIRRIKKRGYALTMPGDPSRSGAPRVIANFPPSARP